MNIIESTFFTILGGLVEGGVGYLATMAGLREKRRDRRLEEHKSNLKVVKKPLIKYMEKFGFSYLVQNR